MIKIFGSPRSSSGRCFWCLEEAGISYETGAIDFKKNEHKSQEFLELNPNGKVPVLQDGEFLIWESLAINFYLAKSYKPELLGRSIKEEALALQWSQWSLGELQAPVIEIFIQKMFVPEDKKDQSLVDKAQAKLPPLLKILNDALKKDSNLVGDQFTLADLNTMSVVSILKMIDVPISEYKNILNWTEKTCNRPAYHKYRELRN